MLHLFSSFAQNYFICTNYKKEMLKRQAEITETKSLLLKKLKEENAFWSYEEDSIILDNIHDEQLIALTMRHLDLDEISHLFNIFSFKKIKDAWKKNLVPEGEYLYTMNRFFAWYYFKAKNPDAYLKSLQTRHLKRLIN